MVISNIKYIKLPRPAECEMMPIQLSTLSHFPTKESGQIESHGTSVHEAIKLSELLLSQRCELTYHFLV